MESLSPRDGRDIFCGGIDGEVVYRFRCDDGKLSARQSIRLRRAETVGRGRLVWPLMGRGNCMWRIFGTAAYFAGDVEGQTVKKHRAAAAMRSTMSVTVKPEEDFDTADAKKRARAE